MPKGESMAAVNPIGILAKQVGDRLRGKEDGSGFQTKAGIEARKKAGLDLPKDNWEATGQAIGNFGQDLTQDSSRRIWWLINALQATGEVINEWSLSKANPALYGRSPIFNDRGKRISPKADAAAIKAGAAHWKDGVVGGDIELNRGYSIKGRGKDAYIEKRNYEPGLVQSLAIPTGIAINSGLGLLTPFGGAEGYKAALPSEEDPTKTSNMLGEIGLKYVMGRTGQMLPYNEFKKVRPDVSADEYGRYKAFKYDKEEDWNPMDGDMTMLGGAIKLTDEGIHGPEVQFLGRSLPVTTGVVPYLTALGGGVAGVTAPIGPKVDAQGVIRSAKARRQPIRGGFVGGMTGLVVGQIAGNLLENERRRRNAAENALNDPQTLLQQ